MSARANPANDKSHVENCVVCVPVVVGCRSYVVGRRSYAVVVIVAVVVIARW